MNKIKRSKQRSGPFIIICNTNTLFIGDKGNVSRFSNLIKDVAINMIIEISNNISSS